MHTENRAHSKRDYLHAAILSLTLLWVAGLSLQLANRYIPIGEGPDELSHLDYTRYLLEHSVSDIDVRAGLDLWDQAPLGQGHQPPLSYLISAGLLSAFFDTSDLGSLIDYSAGLTYSSAGRLFGGLSACSYGLDLSRDDAKTFSARKMLYFLRDWNVVLLLLSIVLTYVAGRLYFGPQVALIASLMHAAIPTAIYRSVFVSNDNLAAALSSFVFVLSCLLAANQAHRLKFLFSLGLGVFCGLAFLAKYTGVITLAIAFSVLWGRGVHLRSWLIQIGLIAAAFAMTVAPDLYMNLAVDGDLLSTEVLHEVVPFLYRPSSFSEVLSSPSFLPTVYERFWINFHVLGPGMGNGVLPAWLLPCWYLLTIGALLGALFILLRREESSKLLLSLFLMLGGMLGLIVLFATKYPLPAGRYLHAVVTPICVLFAAGVLRLMTLLGKKQSFAVLTAAMSSVMLLNSSYSYSRLRSEFQGCFSADVSSVEAGIEARLGDVDADGENELYLFHRIRNRLFIAELHEGKFSIQPKWTRLVGLVADEFEVADLNGDGHDDPLFRRPGASMWTAVDARSVLHEMPARQIPFALHFTAASKALVSDFNGDGKADLALYVPGEATLKIYNSIHLPDRFRREPRPELFAVPENHEAFIINHNGASRVAFYHQQTDLLRYLDSDGVLRHFGKVTLDPQRIVRIPPLATMSFAWLEEASMCYLSVPKAVEAKEQSATSTLTKRCIEIAESARELDDVKILVNSVEESKMHLLLLNRRNLSLESLTLPIDAGSERGD